MSRELDEQIADTVMGWQGLSGREIPLDLVFPISEHTKRIWIDKDRNVKACKECGTLPEFSSNLYDSETVLNRLREKDFEVIVGFFKASVTVELRRWRDRRPEGVEGDPFTHRSRETLVVETGSSMPETLCKAALRISHLLKD
jgi:hypothetical protein